MLRDPPRLATLIFPVHVIAAGLCHLSCRADLHTGGCVFQMWQYDLSVERQEAAFSPTPILKSATAS